MENEETNTHIWHVKKPKKVLQGDQNIGFINKWTKISIKLK